MGFFSKIFRAGRTPPERARKLGRNEPCWCGSGLKYKRCHLESDQRYFARERAATCHSSG